MHSATALILFQPVQPRMTKRATNTQQEVRKKEEYLRLPEIHHISPSEPSVRWSMVNLNFDASFLISVTVMQKTVGLVFMLQHVTKLKNKDSRRITLLLVTCTSTYNSIHMQTRKFIQLHDTQFYKTSNTNILTPKPSPTPKTRRIITLTRTAVLNPG